MTSFYSEEELAQLGLKSYGSNVLISRFASIYSPQNISIGNNVGIDDFCIRSGNISIGNCCHISAYCSLLGTNNVVFPNITVGAGAVTSAMTLINKNLNPWTQNFGIPVREIKSKKQGLLEKAKQLNRGYNISGGDKRLAFFSSSVWITSRRGGVSASKVVRG